MSPIVSGTMSGRNLRVEVNTADHSNADAITALINHAKASKTYQISKGDYELRLIQRGDKKFLELHTRDFVSRLGSFAKGILTSTSRSQRANIRAEARQGAADFVANHKVVAPQVAALSPHLKTSKGMDPVAAIALDQDQASVRRDVNQAMTKLRDQILADPKSCAALATSRGRDQMVYAPLQAALKKNDLQVLRSWTPKWSTSDTCGLLMDVALKLTRNSTETPYAGYARADMFQEPRFYELMDESKSYAKSGQPQQSTLAREFLPEQTAVQQGASATTQRLLELISRNPEVTPEEVEALMNGVSSFWSHSLIKQAKGEFHTTAEVWSSYNQYLESDRVPRNLKALDPSSEWLIDFMQTTDEGRQELLDIHNVYLHAKAQQLSDPGKELVKARLRAYEESLDFRELIRLRMSPQHQAVMRQAEDLQAFAARKNAIRDEILRMRDTGQTAPSAELTEHVQALENALPGRRFLRLDPQFSWTAHEFPSGEPFRSELDKVGENLRQSPHESHPEKVRELVQLQLQELEKDIPAREALQRAYPSFSEVIAHLEQTESTKPLIEKLLAIHRKYRGTAYSAKAAQTIEDKLIEMTGTMPARIKLQSMPPFATLTRQVPHTEDNELQLATILKTANELHWRGNPDEARQHILSELNKLVSGPSSAAT